MVTVLPNVHEVEGSKTHREKSKELVRAVRLVWDDLFGGAFLNDEVLLWGLLFTQL
jgi:hypothetical protein